MGAYPQWCAGLVKLRLVQSQTRSCITWIGCPHILLLQGRPTIKEELLDGITVAEVGGGRDYRVHLDGLQLSAVSQLVKKRKVRARKFSTSLMTEI